MTTYRAYPVDEVERLRARCSVAIGCAVMAGCGCLVLGILLSLVGQSHDAMVRERVEMKLAIQR